MILKFTIPIQVKFGKVKLIKKKEEKGKVNRTAKKELVNSFTPIYGEKEFPYLLFLDLL